MNLFFIIPFAIWALLLSHIIYRTRVLWGLKGRTRWVFMGLFLLLGFSYVPARLLIRSAHSVELVSLFAHGAALFLGLVATLWALLLLIEIGALGIWIVKGLRLKQAQPGPALVLGAVWWAASVGLVLSGLITAQAAPALTRVDVQVPGVTSSTPSRFAVISDLHLGLLSSEQQWQKTLDATRAFAPEALLIVGDLIDDRSERAEEQVAMIRDYFPKLPVYVVTGNHEVYVGLDYFTTLCQRLNFTLLDDRSTTLLPGLTLAGVKDRREDTRENLDKLLAPVQGPLFFLSHRPSTARLLADRAQTLIFSGHTHGGQMLPMNFFVALGNGGFSSGYYPVGAAHLYVSRGAGSWGPAIRQFAPPEMLLVEVRAGLEFSVSFSDGADYLPAP